MMSPLCAAVPRALLKAALRRHRVVRRQSLRALRHRQHRTVSNHSRGTSCPSSTGMNGVAHNTDSKHATRPKVLGGVLHEVDGGEWSRHSRVELLGRVGARWRPFRLQRFAGHRRRIQHVCRGRLPLLRELCCCLSRPSPQQRLACHSFLRFSLLPCTKPSV
jgi:hypothetical protein